MKTVKLKVKINNSYDSEPSSGSGSSGVETNDYEHYTCDEVPNLPLMLNPGFYSVDDPSEQPKEKLKTSSTMLQEPRTKSHSSQESDFEGFTETQIKSTHSNPIECESQTRSSKTLQDYQVQGNSLPDHKVSSRFYDVIIDQNSCNAVDMSLSGTNSKEYYAVDTLSSSSNRSTLSFDGRIKNLISSQPSSKHECISTGQKPSVSKSPKILKAILEKGDTTIHRYTSERSPDLFEEDDDDDDDEDDGDKEIAKEGSTATIENVSTSFKDDEWFSNNGNRSNNCPKESSFADITNEKTTQETTNSAQSNILRQKELLKRIKTCLNGVPPPPSLTILQIDLFAVISKKKQEILNFTNEIKAVSSEEISNKTFLCKPTHSVEEVKAMPWKDVLTAHQHGLCYNLCTASESIDRLSLPLINRFIGSETSTSYTSSFQRSPSSAKKRNLRMKMLTQSPGSRLSHLAKRRAVFSSANLATTLHKSTSSSLSGKQILLDKKKTKPTRKGSTPKRATPKRATPRSRRKTVRKTPSSSARRRLFSNIENPKPTLTRETSKRALFQSPPKHTLSSNLPKPPIKHEVANRVERSKRALFSPDKTQSSFATYKKNETQETTVLGTWQNILPLKRKRNVEETSEMGNCSKITKRDNDDSLITCSLWTRSQSFNIGGESSGTSIMRSISNISSTSTASSSSRNLNRPIIRASSDSTFNTSHLTENHRKKLLWAVSQALQVKQITVSHEHFKKFASVLARVVQRLFLEYYYKNCSSTSETMLKLAKKHMYSVITGKGVDDIYLLAKAKLEEEKLLSSTRLSGYIAPEEYEQHKNIRSQTTLACSFENSMDSSSFTQVSSLSQNLRSIEKISQDNPGLKSATKQPIQPNASLRTSSSKNNLDGNALRENVDCEQRRSAQKNFTGKDQRNVSPYTNTNGKSAKASSLFVPNKFDIIKSNSNRAKRQISFDS